MRQALEIERRNVGRFAPGAASIVKLFSQRRVLRQALVVRQSRLGGRRQGLWVARVSGTADPLKAATPTARAAKARRLLRYERFM
jgi:hypothetical protein